MLQMLSKLCVCVCARDCWASVDLCYVILSSVQTH